MKMPFLPVERMVEGLSDSDARVVRAAFSSRGVRDGYASLRANKPFKRVTTPEEGYANYVWRILCFDLAGFGKHVCMPICADFDASFGFELENGGRVRYGCEGYDEYREKEKNNLKRLNDLISRVESVLPIEAKKGIIRWGRALGYL